MQQNMNAEQRKELAVRLAMMVLSSVLVAINLKSFVQTGDLFPGGFTGLTRLIQRCALEYADVDLPFGPINLLFNAVPAAISFKLVGKKFTFYSCMVIAMTSIFTDLMPSLPVTEDILLISVFGGIINGFAISLCLRVRITSGGTDFIAIPLAERKNIDAWNYIFCANVCLLAVAGFLFGWDRALYSIIFQFTSTQMIKMLDPDGQRSTLLIITGRESAGGVCAQIQDTHHSATLVEGVGLYNGQPCVMIYTVVAGNQVRSLTKKVRQADPKAFVNVLRTEKLAGNFYRAPRE